MSGPISTVMVMARTTSPEARAHKITEAAELLPNLLEAAAQTTLSHGYSSPEALAAWAAVEEAGATIHRQSRLLAGKSRGG